MRVNFTSFNYKSTDTAAEEKNYLEYYVALAKRLPGLRFDLTGKFRSQADSPQPPHVRAAILGFDTADAATQAMASDLGKEVRQDGAAHLTGARPLALDATVIVPFASPQVGKQYFLMAAEFDLKHGSEGLEAADRRYLTHHTQLARQMPGLRHYVTGRLVPAGRVAPDRLRMAFLVFDSAAALRDAYRSPLGQELIKDEEATIANARVYRLDATVQV